MNNERRKTISTVINHLREVNSAFSALFARLDPSIENLLEDVRDLRDAEQEALDNLPDAVRDGEKGSDMQGAIDFLDSALNEIESLNDLITTVESSIKDSINELLNARGEE